MNKISRFEKIKKNDFEVTAFWNVYKISSRKLRPRTIKFLAL